MNIREAVIEVKEYIDHVCVRLSCDGYSDEHWQLYDEDKLMAASGKLPTDQGFEVLPVATLARGVLSYHN